MAEAAVASEDKPKKKVWFSAITRDSYWSNEELCRLYHWIKEHEREAEWRTPCFFVRFALGTGLRIGEIEALRVPEDCTPDGVIIVRKSKTGRARQVRVTPELLPYYQAWLMARPRRKTIPLLSWGPHAKAYEQRHLRRFWHQVCEAAGVRPLQGPHGARHTYATWELASRRRLPHEVQAALGHSKFDMTANIYAGAPAEWAYRDQDPDWWEAAK